MSYCPDRGSFVMKYIAMVWNGSKCSRVRGIIAVLRGSGVDFTFLTGDAALHILLHVLFNVGPPEVSLGRGIGIFNSWMSSGWVIVEKLNYPPPQIIVTSNNRPGPLPPVSIFVY